MDFIAALYPTAAPVPDPWARTIQKQGSPDLGVTSANGQHRLEVKVQQSGAGHADQLTIGPACVINGVCFREGSEERADLTQVLHGDLPDLVLQSDGASFAERFWGHYSGLFFDFRSGRLLAIRDPVGGRMLFYARVEDSKLVLLSNSLKLMCEMLGGKLAVDRNMVVMGLAYLNALPTRRTAFAAIKSLLPGECMTIDPDSGSTISDLPWWRRVAQQPTARQSISQAVERSTKAWSSVGGTIALQLSGGLDSSGLLGMLAKNGHAGQVHCLTCYRSNGVTDERKYARMAAEHTGAPLTEFDIEELRYPRQLWAPYRFTVRPHAAVLFPQLDSAFDAYAEAAGCATYWLGFGGDTLFMSVPKAAVLIDALRLVGVRGAFERAIEIALYDEKQLWRVLWDAATKSWNRGYLEWAKGMRSPWQAGVERLDNLDEIGFGLIEDCFARTPLPGQRSRLYDVYYDLWATAEQRPFFTSGGLDYAAPYYSEPVIEAAASVPSYEMVKFGLNRFAQRELVGEVMPAAIAERVVKGGADDQVIRALLADADQIEDFLAHGQLAAMGLVDVTSARIERDNIAAEAYRNFNIVNMLASEVWLDGHRDILSM